MNNESTETQRDETPMWQMLYAMPQPPAILSTVRRMPNLQYLEFMLMPTANVKKDVIEIAP